MWIVIALLIVIFASLFPYAKRAVTRRRTWRRLCRAIRREGGRVRRMHRFPSLSRNASGAPELLVRHAGVQYAVKLWTPHHSDAELRIFGDGSAVETRTVFAPLSPKGLHRSRILRGPRYAPHPIRASVRVPQSMKSVSILLLTPPYRRILYRKGEEWHKLSPGETLFGATVATPADFLARLRREKEETAVS